MILSTHVKTFSVSVLRNLLYREFFATYITNILKQEEHKKAVFDPSHKVEEVPCDMGAWLPIDLRLYLFRLTRLTLVITTETITT